MRLICLRAEDSGKTAARCRVRTAQEYILSCENRIFLPNVAQRARPVLASQLAGVDPARHGQLFLDRTRCCAWWEYLSHLAWPRWSAAHPYATQFCTGAALRRLHSVSAGDEHTTYSQWNSGGRTALETGARRQAVQHKRAGILRKLDRRQVIWERRDRMPVCLRPEVITDQYAGEPSANDNWSVLEPIVHLSETTVRLKLWGWDVKPTVRGRNHS